MRNGWAPRAVVLVVLSVSSFSDFAFGRMRWAERDGHAVLLHPRRFGQEHPAVVDQISAACDNGVCATLGGGAITPLLAEQPECTQQDFADKIINTSRQFDAATQAKLISLAKLYRQAEKNTPPDFTTNPPTNRNSVFCQKAPQNPELNGLFQAQDPANNPNVFFDPALQKSVLKGSQPNTEPFKGTAALSGTTKATTSGNQNITSGNQNTTSGDKDASVKSENQKITSGNQNTTSGNKDASVKKGVVCAANRTTSGPPPHTSSPPPKTDSSLATSTNSTSGASNFGKCTTPEIKFAVGLDNRRETAFAPSDPQSYNHGSADNIGVISSFICLALTNTCGANAAAKAQCTQAQAAANAATPPQTGAQADAFNLVFGLKTDFAAVQPISNTGQPVGDSNAKSTPPSSNTVKTDTSNSSKTTNTGNLQTFTGELGEVTAPAVTALGNGQFQVENNASFKSLQNALQRSCDVQHNKCADAANASGNKGDLTVAACGTQQTQCDAEVAA